MSAKQQSRTIILQLKGSEEALEATFDMMDSVVEALQSQYPKLTVECNTHIDEAALKPIIILPLVRKRAAK